jgi:hypothetical protein
MAAMNQLELLAGRKAAELTVPQPPRRPLLRMLTKTI